MEPVREEDALAEHALEARAELDLGHGERVAEVERAVHVRVRPRPEPLREPLAELGRRQARRLRGRRRVDLEEALGGPARLRALLVRDERVALGRLPWGVRA
jgi:hypothetical protein